VGAGAAARSSNCCARFQELSRLFYVVGMLGGLSTSIKRSTLCTLCKNPNIVGAARCFQTESPPSELLGSHRQEQRRFCLAASLSYEFLDLGRALCHLPGIEPVALPREGIHERTRASTHVRTYCGS